MRELVKYALFLLVFLLFLPENSLAASGAGLPEPAPVQAAVTDSVYVVKQGDTYYSLSRRFNIPLDSLQHWNGTQLQIGQTLYLTSARPAPKKSVAKAAPSPVRSSAAPVSGKQGGGQFTTAAGSTTASASPAPVANKTRSRILVVPFDPYLYFSDADHEIARQSRIPLPNIRHAFRNRLDAMLATKEYETIHLLGGVYRDSVNELRNIYKSFQYSYQDNKPSKYNRQPVVQQDEQVSTLDWLKRQKEKLAGRESGDVPVAKDDSKHYGVTVKDPTFFDRYNSQYGIDYYVFINQFEVKTIYENCLDRAALNYERKFMVHYSIYDSSGKLISGNKVNVPYESNINDVQRIVSDTMPAMAQRVLADLPPADN